MKSLLKGFVICATAAVFTLAAYAQDMDKDKEMNMKGAAAMQQQAFQVSKVLNQEVKDPQGQDLGKLKDICMNPKTGENFALFEREKNRYVALPWQLLSVTQEQAGNYKLTAHTTKNALNSAPTVSQDELANLSNPQFTEKIYSYFHTQPPTAMGAPGMGEQKEKDQGQQPEQQPQPEQPQPQQQP